MNSKVVHEFTYREHKCEIVMVSTENIVSFPMSALIPNEWYCGYVYTDKATGNIDDHARSIECHGGITYDNGEMIGFDCNHCDDEGIEVQDLDYCIGECMAIVDQLVEK